MKRSGTGAAAVAAILAVAAGCGGAPSRYGTGSPLREKARATSAPTGLRVHSAPSKGRLTYAVALAAGDRTLVSVELELAFALVVYDLIGKRARQRFRQRVGEATYDIHDLAVDAAGKQAWIASADGSVRGFELRRGRLLARLHLGAPATAVALSGDGRYLATGSSTGVLCLRRRRDLALLQCAVAHDARIGGLAFDRRSKSLASVAWDGSAVVWQLPGLALRARRAFAGSANAVAFSPAKDLLAIAMSTRPPVRTPEVAALEQRSGGVSDDRAAVVVWDLDGDTTQTCRGHTGPVTAVSFTPGGARLVSASWDRSVRMWATQRCRELVRAGGFRQLVRDVFAGTAGRRVAAGGWAGDLTSNSTLVFDLLYP